MPWPSGPAVVAGAGKVLRGSMRGSKAHRFGRARTEHCVGCSSGNLHGLMRVMLLDGRRHENAESGYGQLAAGIKSELERRGVEIELDASRHADVALYVCPPYSISERPPSCPAAIFTMHELDHLPDGKKDWPARLNRMDLVITPTSWNRSIWKSLGVTTQIEVAPLGIDSSIFRPRWMTTCRLLTVHSGLGSRSSRENWRETLQAYTAAFAPDDDVELVIKTWSWHEEAFQTALQEVRAARGYSDESGPLVTVVDAELSGDAMRELYLSAWLFIKNANREGWSLPCTEAVACDLRIAATEIQPLISHLPASTRWFTLGDVDELRYLMRHEKRHHASQLTRAHRHTWRNTGSWVYRYLCDLVASKACLQPGTKSSPGRECAS